MEDEPGGIADAATAAGAPPPTPSAFVVRVRGSEIGRYIVLEELGRGAMGVVVRAYDPELDRRVAIKLLQPRAAVAGDTLEARERLIAEAQALAKLAHPNVVGVFDVGTSRDEVFVAMELIEGQDLAAWMKHGPKPWKDVLRVFGSAGEGLAAAHDAGLVHRDFKPANVLLGESGRVAVGDFGLARASGDVSGDPKLTAKEFGAVLATPHTEAGIVLGTPAYMAVEQHFGVPAGEKSDQYSFCTALYEALYGTRPFEGATMRELAEAKAGSLPEAPAGSSVPRWVRQLVLQGLAVEPEQRHASMSSLVGALRDDPWVRRRRWLAVGGALTVGVAATLALGGIAKPEQVCGGASEHLDPVWNIERQDAIERAFVATEKPYAGDAVDRVRRAVDTFTEEWAGGYRLACEATSVRHEQSERALDLRMTCLQTRLATLDEMLNVFETADAKVVQRAVAAIEGLPHLAVCHDVEALERPVPLPEDTGRREQLEQLTRQLAAVRAKQSAGQFKAALDAAISLSSAAEKLQYPPLLAEVLELQGALEARTGDSEAGAATLDRAIRYAVEGGDIRLLAEAAIESMFVIGHDLVRPEEARRSIELARGALAALREDTKLRSQFDNRMGAIALRQGENVASAEHFARALAGAEAVYGAAHGNVARIRSNYAVSLTLTGKRAEGLEQAMTALEESGVIYGLAHPSVALSHNNVGRMLTNMERRDEAVRHYQDAIRIGDASLGEDHPQVVIMKANTGDLLRELGKFDEAHALLQAAMAAARERVGDDNLEIAMHEDYRAQWHRDQKQYAEARDGFLRSLAIREKAGDGKGQDTARTLIDVADVHIALGDAEAAVPLLERALTMLETDSPDPVPKGDALFALARALWESGGDRLRARTAATDARDMLASGVPPGKNLPALERWLEEHGR